MPPTTTTVAATAKKITFNAPLTLCISCVHLILFSFRVASLFSVPELFFFSRSLSISLHSFGFWALLINGEHVVDIGTQLRLFNIIRIQTVSWITWNTTITCIIFLHISLSLSARFIHNNPSTNTLNSLRRIEQEKRAQCTKQSQTEGKIQWLYTNRSGKLKILTL